MRKIRTAAAYYDRKGEECADIDHFLQVLNGSESGNRGRQTPSDHRGKVWRAELVVNGSKKALGQ